MNPPLAPEQVWALLLALRHQVRKSPVLPARCGLRLDPAGQPMVTPDDDPATLIDIADDGTWNARVSLSDASPSQGSRLNLRELSRRLRERGLFGLFIEGGGLTVSAFLEQGLLDRLQITVAPLIIGSGRPGLTLPPIRDLHQGLRPRHRRYVMGEDVLFDCWLSE
jgi:riboflavin biosynthesis pyrimidine reductase